MTAIILVTLALAQAPISVRYQSPEHRLPLVELFTSEGCSSCPAAERMVAALAGPGGGWDRQVVLAYHLGIWDHGGWRDRFARREFDERLQDYASASGSESIYTPHLRIDGEETRVRGEALGERVAKAAREVAAVDLSLEAEWNPRARTLVVRAERRARAERALPEGDILLRVAVFERGLSTAVEAGENRGRTLSHDFVVRAFPEATGEARVETRIRVPSGWNPAQLGVAAFAQAASNRVVLQSVAGPLQASAKR